MKFHGTNVVGLLTTVQTAKIKTKWSVLRLLVLKLSEWPGTNKSDESSDTFPEILGLVKVD